MSLVCRTAVGSLLFRHTLKRGALTLTGCGPPTGQLLPHAGKHCPTSPFSVRTMKKMAKTKTKTKDPRNAYRKYIHTNQDMLLKIRSLLRNISQYLTFQIFFSTSHISSHLRILSIQPRSPNIHIFLLFKRHFDGACFDY